jgi:hypothetical protein
MPCGAYTAQGTLYGSIETNSVHFTVVQPEPTDDSLTVSWWRIACEEKGIVEATELNELIDANAGSPLISAPRSFAAFTINSRAGVSEIQNRQRRRIVLYEPDPFSSDVRWSTSLEKRKNSNCCSC